MITTPLPLNPTLADRFALTVAFVLKEIGYDAWRRQVGGPLLAAMTQRIWRLGARFRKAFAQWQAGTLKLPRPRPSRAGAAPAGPDNLANLPPGDYRVLKRLLPRDFGWVKRLMPGIAHLFDAFFPLVEDAEMQAMVAAAPQVGRILRPLCHTLGLPLPEWLQLPKRPRPKPRLPPPLRGRAGVRGASAPAPAAQAPPRPLDVTKLSSVAYGHFLHPENEKHPVGTRPPNRIGYARSRWPPDRGPGQAPKNRY